jgi:hypothetical protein
MTDDTRSGDAAHECDPAKMLSTREAEMRGIVLDLLAIGDRLRAFADGCDADAAFLMGEADELDPPA